MNILIVILSIFLLIFLHELGHFIFAKRYGVRVDEFGIGIPPRIIGKKIGETIYSLNWIPLGGFVRLHGENGGEDDERSFSQKPIYQRAVILFAGVAAFFVVAAVLFSFVSFSGVLVGVSDEEEAADAKVIITSVVPDSPAEEAGLVAGDVIEKAEGENISKVGQLISLIEGADKVDLTVSRGEEKIGFSISPRPDPPEEEGAIGITMARAVEERSSLYMAPVDGTMMMANTTKMVVFGFYTVLHSLATGTELPHEMDVGGPVRIVEVGAESMERGFMDYINFVGLISVSLAVLNILPIPALDGGRIFFLGIEKVKGSPIPEKVEQGLNAFFFLLLITLMIVVTFKDIQGLI